MPHVLIYLFSVFNAMDLVRKIKKIIRQDKLIVEGDRVLIGCSGGIDSVTLLFVLREISHDLPFELGVAHVNHQLRAEESDRDEDFVRGLADRFSIPCYVRRVNVKDKARKTGKSIQHAGRDIRYCFFDEMADQLNFNKIAIAHNLDDQVETFLFRIIKGTGIRGLSSIPFKRGKIIRPFLTIYRSEIESYVKTRTIRFMEDSSNTESVYERNFVRREILPVLEKLNPAVKEKVFALLHDLTEINLFFDEKAEEYLGRESRDEEGDIVTGVQSLKELDEEVRYRVFLKLLQRIEPPFLPHREHIRLIEKVLAGTRPNLSAMLPNGIKVKKTYDQIIFTKKATAQPVEVSFKVRSGSNKVDPFRLTLDVAELDGQADDIPITPNIAYFDLEKLGDLSVRTFVPGDRFVPLGMTKATKLKDFFIGRKIPRDERRRLPLLLSGGDIIWVVGHRIDERYKVTKETTRVLKVTAYRS